MSTILITGASSGIGAAAARLLAPRHELLLVARRRERLEALARELPQARIVAADLASDGGLASVVAAVEQPLGALVHNAGVFVTARAEQIDRAHLERLWRINVDAPLLLTARLLPRLEPGGSIVVVSSIVAERAFAGCGAYTASKCALEGWARVLREELRPRRIRVGIVAPGATDTEIWPPEYARADRARMLRPEQVAEAVRLIIEAPAQAAYERITVTPQAGAV
ncbi:MAG: SDR family NAD(P)-dependent oxidoreductase [Planctomycetota bacterium]|nr:SDR family NAD(P)-dependent oxidoreductase [Planctomycetota bacterium]MCX8039154.1 SDR family NAD(P)-dependent oxidoreductase [Planctomycetota bacterium]MDW8372148.1 SDR family NAD(P)-dependent oxidoreductase [Planctomycetota bacterium]